MNTVGMRIAKRRKELGITQEELAKRLGYKYKSSVNKVESGTNDVPLNKIEEYAKALDTTPGYLVGWEDEQENAPTSFDRDKSIETIMSMFRKLTPEEKLDVICYVSNIIDKHED